LSFTLFLQIDLGSHPFVWAGPLSIYLMTLAMAFTSGGVASLSVISKFAPLAVLVVGYSLVRPWSTNIAAQATLAVCLIPLLAACHLWLARCRPNAREHLLPFYVFSAFGGLLAAALLVFAVPTVFNPEWFGDPNRLFIRDIFRSASPEMILAMIACAVVSVRLVDRKARLFATIEGALLGVVFALGFGSLLQIGLGTSIWSGQRIAEATAVAVVVLRLTSREQLVAAVGSMLVTLAILAPREDPIAFRTRSDFGQLTVTDRERDYSMRILRSGSTLHGAQNLNCVKGGNSIDCGQPTTYYARKGPLGTVLTEIADTRTQVSIGAIGLGVGTLAAYCRPNDKLTFFEIDRTVVALATEWFRFIQHAESNCGDFSIVQSDGRIGLRGSLSSVNFDVVVVDAFSSDSVPSHLLTVEAFREVHQRLGQTGIAAYHVSSRYLDISSVLAAAVKDSGLSWTVIADPGGRGYDHVSSTWLFAGVETVLSPLRARLLRDDGGFSEVAVTPLSPAWTDQKHSMFQLLWR
jgi:hypothetical protein